MLTKKRKLMRIQQTHTRAKHVYCGMCTMAGESKPFCGFVKFCWRPIYWCCYRAAHSYRTHYIHTHIHMHAKHTIETIRNRGGVLQRLMFIYINVNN